MDNRGSGFAAIIGAAVKLCEMVLVNIGSVVPGSNIMEFSHGMAFTDSTAWKWDGFHLSMQGYTSPRARNSDPSMQGYEAMAQALQQEMLGR